MVDLEYLKRIKLAKNPIGQRIVANLLLTPNYRWFQKVEICLEGAERIPRGENVIFAMNHTDRFNYWPFQYRLWKMKEFPFTTVWVKGKYYRNALLGRGLDLCNGIPVPSMGYLLEEFYRKRFKRRLEKPLYRTIRDVIDGRYEKMSAYPAAAAEALSAMGEYIRETIGGGREQVSAYPAAAAEALSAVADRCAEALRGYYEKIMERVAEISCTALCEKGLNLIIFPEGTRSVQLGQGRTGLAQLALYTGKKVVPVACNNSEQVYPDSLPFARSGRIVYRVGEPLSLDGKLRPFRIEESFKLLSRESQMKHREQFEAVTRIVMESINEMLDDRYRWSAEHS
ncbi:MAG TPA: lysophospholipid acyltransferase family protein [Syntrophales bacterium]|nr:lysophospholipid acyltransferase family protein [Syntrophales bacterium]